MKSRLFLVTSLSLLSVVCSVHASSGDGFDFAECERIAKNPSAIMALPAERRIDALARIKDYREATAMLADVSSYTLTDRTKKIELARSAHNFYMELKFAEQERIQAFELKKTEIQSKVLELRQKVGEAKTEAGKSFREMEAWVRREERCIFGWMKDNILWGRDVPPPPADADLEEIMVVVNRSAVQSFEFLDQQIAHLQAQHVMTLSDFEAASETYRRLTTGSE